MQLLQGCTFELDNVLLCHALLYVQLHQDMYMLINGSCATQLGQGCDGQGLQDSSRSFGSHGPYGLATVAMGLQVCLSFIAAQVMCIFQLVTQRAPEGSKCIWPAGSCQEAYMHHQSWDAL